MHVASAPLGILMALVIACAGDARPASSAKRFKSAANEAEAMVARDIQAAGIDARGAIVEVTSPRGTWCEAFGTADASGKPMTTDMRFRIASISKTFTGAAVLRLADEGKLSISDPISKYLPNPNPGQFPHWNEITIQQLANHTSGLSEITDSPAFQARKRRDPSARWSPEQLVRFAHEEHLPGAVYDYANTNYVILGMLIERVSGQSVRSFFRDTLIGPLGLKGTDVAEAGDKPKLNCHGYAGKQDLTCHNPSWAWCAGHLVSNVADLTSWIRAECTGMVLSPASQKKLVAIVKPSVNAGFGIENYNGWLGHTGRIEGYSSACFYSPTLDSTVVVLVNRMDPDDPQNGISREIPLLNDVISAFFPGNTTGLSSRRG